MGNKNSCCVYHSPKNRSKKQAETYVYKPRPPVEEEPSPLTNPQSTPSLPGVPHISEREPEGELSPEIGSSDVSLVSKSTLFYK